jgi:uncharacterized protein YacL
MWVKFIVALCLSVITALTSASHIILYALITLVLSVGIIFSDKWIPPVFRYPVFIAFIGMGLGFWFASVVYEVFRITAHLKFLVDAPFLFYSVFGLAGFYLGLQGASRLNWVMTGAEAKKQEAQSVGVAPKILDTSSIIDSRIIDVSETGFIEGVILIPKFILNELQQVADSTDPIKRSRGRKGLTELNRLKKSKSLMVKIIEKDYPAIKEVDHKLIKMAQDKKASLITTDYNLNKIASLEGVQVLNINELSNALKPVVMTNEELRITVIKEGKDPNQGIGYLDDGTMVVVDGGREFLGEEVDVVVTSVLQTAAGRMIFTQPAEKMRR